MENPFRTEKFSRVPEQSLTLLYRNPRFELPVDPKSLAVFLDREHGTLDLRILPYHHRSADTVKQHVMKEKGTGNVFCQFDIKGLGFLFPEQYESSKEGVRFGSLKGYPEAYLQPESVEEPWGYKSLGLMDERMALSTIENAKKLNAAGMRTEAIAAVYRLTELTFCGAPISVEEFTRGVSEDWLLRAKTESSPEKAERLRAMAKDAREQFDPVLVIRLMRSVFRIRDFRDAETPAQANAMLEECCANLNAEAVAQERPERFSPETREARRRWMHFIARWSGKNVGILHAQGLTHGFLHMGNLSLAGEVVDLDSITPALVKKVFRGKKENKARWVDQFRAWPFFYETEDGCVIASDSPYRLPDPRFGLPKLFTKDLRDLCYSFRQLAGETLPRFFGDTLDMNAIAAEMTDGYLEGFGDGKVLRGLNIDPERLKEVFTQVVREVVAEGKHYGPIEPDPREA